ncbi:hypothetical protein JRO89_XS13G0022400 [Xanthoceras sorbifolium]|uniref:Peroxisome biogenesis protein 3-2-like n=1 Tax=Xanthoceras sorbifolium TaxID=99658 RepID=A0ABQ8H639_9ROSI|nr:hypothetical protein JRO89_XS13G0022400 [Xanthoceras sorbifolium]
MLSLRDFWRRHRRKIFVTAGVLGGGYLLYKLYDAKRRVADLERQQREHDESIKAQMQAHFENVQRIADVTTLPHAINYLNCRIAEELDLLQLTEKLMRGKEHPSSLSPSEKLELWDRLKILSFTRMVVSLWAVTMLSLYIRVQVNILGRHLYIDTARSLGSSFLAVRCSKSFHAELKIADNILRIFDPTAWQSNELIDKEDADPIDRDDEQKFLASVDFLANYGIQTLISNLQVAATEVLKGTCLVVLADSPFKHQKQLRDIFNTAVLHETVMQIIEMFMSTGSPHQWVDFLMPGDARLYQLATASSPDNIPLDVSKFDQLMVETRAVLSSAEYRSVVEISLKAAVDALVDEMGVQSGGSLVSGMPLAKLVPRIAQIGPCLLDEPSKNRFIQTIRSIQEVEIFFTLLYANMSTS